MQAVTWLERSMAEYREFVSTHQMLVGVYAALGRMDEARDASAIFARKVPGMSLEMFNRTTPHQSPVFRDIVSAGLKATGIPD